MAAARRRVGNSGVEPPQSEAVSRDKRRRVDKTDSSTLGDYLLVHLLRSRDAINLQGLAANHGVRLRNGGT